MGAAASQGLSWRGLGWEAATQGWCRDLLCLLFLPTTELPGLAGARGGSPARVEAQRDHCGDLRGAAHQAAKEGRAGGGRLGKKHVGGPCIPTLAGEPAGSGSRSRAWCVEASGCQENTSPPYCGAQLFLVLVCASTVGPTPPGPWELQSLMRELSGQAGRTFHAPQSGLRRCRRSLLLDQSPALSLSEWPTKVLQEAQGTGTGGPPLPLLPTATAIQSWSPSPHLATKTSSWWKTSPSPPPRSCLFPFEGQWPPGNAARWLTLSPASLGCAWTEAAVMRLHPAGLFKEAPNGAVSGVASSANRAFVSGTHYKRRASLRASLKELYRFNFLDEPKRPIKEIGQ